MGRRVYGKRTGAYVSVVYSIRCGTCFVPFSTDYTECLLMRDCVVIYSDQANTWNAAQGSASRTISQSSGGDNNSDSGWSGQNMNRTSPPNIVSSQPPSAGISHEPPNWATNGPIDPMRNKGGRWEGNSGGAHRAHSVSDVGTYFLLV